MKINLIIISLIFIAVTGCSDSGKKTSVENIRRSILLNEGWCTVAYDTTNFVFVGLEQPGIETDNWEKVNIPHNWDDYGGYRRLKHGNRHGTAWYRKNFFLDKSGKDKRYFLWFEGVGSYATVWLNGDSVGYHAGGRTSFTIDVTDAIKPGKENLLAVRASHPANIRDLPWVCGGCSPEWGFSEGSQPFGIFRPVHLIVTNQVRIEPFGVHIWNDNTISKEKASLYVSTEVKNYGTQSGTFQIVTTLHDEEGKIIQQKESDIELLSAQSDTVRQIISDINNPHLWSPGNPYLYRVETEIKAAGKTIDRVSTPYGIRWINWDMQGEDATNRFYVNGEPVFINGIGEYEHLLGQSHAFTNEQIDARVAQVKAAGFNAFRDAHQPHNLRYQKYWDESGILWWTQMAAHIWFDTPDFRENFKSLLHDWVKERRNSPSVILWGLENESTLPTDFAKECTELIRKLDPTTSSQRLVTTCNGGTGTDWNVIQNWSGTYGGNPELYDREISEQFLNGEYGAWRSLGLHTEGGFDQNGPLSEERMALLLESKIRLAESVKDKCCGQFLWLFNSHDNPGRVQSGEGSRETDRVGPVNYKGLFTIWGEPLDAYYMYRANYASKENEPMVYIAMHTWPDRWISPGIKNGITIYSNCDEVELFNGFENNSLGVQSKKGIGTHFEWNNVDINNNILYAVGYVDGKKVASDLVQLNHIPPMENIEKLYAEEQPLIEVSDRKYIYLVNCGGPDYTDKQGNIWHADVHKTNEGNWGSVSWTDDYNNLPAFFGSQRQSFDPVQGTSDQELFKNFRFGRDKLQYKFPVPNGEYQIELFFTEPWYGTGGSLDCTGWRIFDVAVNNTIVIDDLDIWKEIGHDKVLKKTVTAHIGNGELVISFPEVKAGQAIISAVAISTENTQVHAAQPSTGIISAFEINNSQKGNDWQVQTWMDTDVRQYSNSTATFYSLPAEFYGAEWIRTPLFVDNSTEIPASFKVASDARVYIAMINSMDQIPGWLNKYEPLSTELKSTLNGGSAYKIFRKEFKKGEQVNLYVQGKELNKKPMYTVIVVPVTSLDDPIDLRKTVSYDALANGCVGQAKSVHYVKKECVLIPGKNSSYEWEISVGLASKYGLEFRYINEQSEPLPVAMEIVTADGRILWKGIQQFLPSGKKWKSHRTDTQTTINAGTYKLRVTPAKNSPLYFDWLKVQ